MQSLKRVLYEDNLLISELKAIGWTVFNKAVSGGLLRHRHDDSFELCYIVQGELKWWVNDEQYTVSRGNYFLTKPDEPHGGVNDVMERCELFWIQVTYPNIAGNIPHETSMLLDELRHVKHRAFPATTNMAMAFQNLIDEHVIRDTYSATRTRAMLFEILVNIARSCERFSASMFEKDYSSQIAEAITWINKSLHQQFVIAEVAEVVNMSTNYFQKRFLEEVGTPPAEYVMRLRVKQARHMLTETPFSITTIAHKLGFASSQYFATVFKKYTSLTPREYRNLYST